MTKREQALFTDQAHAAGFHAATFAQSCGADMHTARERFLADAARGFDAVMAEGV